MPNKKPPATDWQARDIADWTVGTFQAYLKAQHQERYGIAYTARNYGIEGRWLKTMIGEHGPAAVKAFIDACNAEYRPTREYPGLNFGFMHTYMKGRVMPRVLAQVAAEEKKAARRAEVAPEVGEDLLDWL